MTRGRTPGWWGLLPLYLAIATAAGFVDFRVRPAINADKAFTEYVPAVLDGSAAPPARYRILAPYAYAALERWTGLEPQDAWIVFRWICLLGALLASHLYFRTWFDTAPAVAGAALTVALLPLTYTNGWGHPDHLVELGLFTLAAACVARDWRLGFLIVLVFNGLNRETSVFLLVLCLLARPISRPHLTWVAAAVAVWLAVYLGLRWSLGWQPYDPRNVAANLEAMFRWELGRDLYYRLFQWFFVILVVPLAVLIGWSWTRQPRFMRVAAGAVAPALLLTGFVFSSVFEPRVFTPLLPLMIPGVLVALSPGSLRS